MAVNPLQEYVIRFLALKPGRHHYDFKVDGDFFKEFPFSLVPGGNLKVDLELDKQSESYMVLHFHITGTIDVSCDRCLDDYAYPVDIEQNLYVKLSGHADDPEDDELVMLPNDAYELDVSPFIYEFINLSVPLRRVCESVGKACNPDMLKRISNAGDEEGSTAAADENGTWAALKALKNGDEEESTDDKDGRRHEN